MPSVSAPITPSGSSQAVWQAWCVAVSTALDNAGVTRVLDTGAVASPSAWNSIPKPGTTSTVAGFEIRKLDDPAPGASPVYIKFEYGVSGNVTYPFLAVQVGTGTNGAGTMLVGANPAPARIQVVGSQADSNPATLFVACDGDGFVFVHAPTAANGVLRGVLAVDRPRQPDGTAAPHSGWPDTGIVRYYMNGSASSASMLTIDPVNDEHADGDRTWRWDGEAWLAVPAALDAAAVGADPEGTAAAATAALADDVATALAAKSDTGHGHAIADVAELVDTLAGKADTGHNHDDAYAAIGHTHPGGVIFSQGAGTARTSITPQSLLTSAPSLVHPGDGGVFRIDCGGIAVNSSVASRSIPQISVTLGSATVTLPTPTAWAVSTRAWRLQGAIVCPTSASQTGTFILSIDNVQARLVQFDLTQDLSGSGQPFDILGRVATPDVVQTVKMTHGAIELVPVAA